MTDERLDPELRDLAEGVRKAIPECYSPDERDELIRQALLASNQEHEWTSRTRWTGRLFPSFEPRPGLPDGRLGSYLRSRATAGAVAFALALALVANEWGLPVVGGDEPALLARAPRGIEPSAAPEVAPLEASAARGKPASTATAQEGAVEQMIQTAQQKELSLRHAGRLLLSAGTRLRIRETAERIDLELEAGALLLDVAKESDIPTLSVGIADSRLWVDGTIFSVEAAADNYRVEVFEGKVRLETPTTTTPLVEGAVHTRGVMPRALPAGWRARAEGRARERLLRETKAPVRPVAERQSADAIQLGEAQEALRKGDFDKALSLSERKLESSADPSWLLLAGDAARAARKTRLAIDYYRRLSELSHAGARRFQGAYLAARLEAEGGNHAVAWSLLQNSGATRTESPLAETASMLSISLSKAMGQLDQLKDECERFSQIFDEEPPAECDPIRTHQKNRREANPQ